MKLSEALIASQKSRVQITGDLVKKDDSGEICGYCALGALACEKGTIDKKLSVSDIGGMSYVEIIRSYNVLNPMVDVKMPKGNISYEGEKFPISTAIFKLNDAYHWSFKKIGNWLAKLEKQGVIKYAES